MATLIKKILKSVLPILLFFVPLLIFSSCENTNGSPGGNSISTPDTQGSEISDLLKTLQMYEFKDPVKAPEFKLPSLDGREIRLRDYRGRVVLLNFWATWCPWCRKEMPFIQELHDTLDSRYFVILAIDMKQDKRTVERFIKNRGLTFTVLLDREGSVSDMYGVSSTPMKFLIDPEGNLRGAAIGYKIWNLADIKSLVDALIKEKTRG